MIVDKQRGNRKVSLHDPFLGAKSNYKGMPSHKYQVLFYEQHNTNNQKTAVGA